MNRDRIFDIGIFVELLLKNRGFVELMTYNSIENDKQNENDNADKIRDIDYGRNSVKIKQL